MSKPNALRPHSKLALHLLAAAWMVAALTSASGATEPTIGWTRLAVAVSADTPRGYVEYQNSCSVCHGPMPERPGTRALAAKYQGSLPALLEDRIDLKPQFIRTMVRDGITVMPPFRKTEVTDAQLEAIIGYLTRPRP